MMQEAKSSCAGQWYLPAGKMEPGEDIVEAAVREVKEETGLEFEVTSLLLGKLFKQDGKLYKSRYTIFYYFSF